MRRSNAISFGLIIFLIIFSSTFVLIIIDHKFSKKSSYIKPDQDEFRGGFQKLDEFGNVTIFNVTIDKIIAEIGENVTVSSVYSLFCNDSYEREYGMIGIEKFGWYEYKNTLIASVENYNVSEIISIDPNHFDGNDVCKGRVEIKISNILNPMNFKIYTNFTIENLEIRKAKLNYSLIGQYPITVFSQDLLNFSFQIYNEHAQDYVFSDSNMKIFVNNQNNSLNVSKYTDSDGFLNFTINCSSLGAGNYTIQLENDETVDYEPTQVIIQLKVLDENSCINVSLLNVDEVYTNVNFDDSNYTKAFYLIQCEFDANITYTSNIENGQCIEIGNRYFATISSPKTSGTYQILFSAQPKVAGKLIEFNETLQVKRRPIALDPTISHRDKQSHLYFHIKIIDILKNQLIDTNNNLIIFAKYNGSNRFIGTVECNSSGIACFEWQFPNMIVENYISFTFQFNETPVYFFLSLTKNITITKIEYSGPFQAYSSQNISIIANLYALNGSKLSNQLIELKINGENFNLTTNTNGKISYSFTTPSHATLLRIELHFPGSMNVISSTLILDIEIRLDLFHQIWNSLGYILAGISIGIVLLIYLKKQFTKRNLATLKVD